MEGVFPASHSSPLSIHQGGCDEQDALRQRSGGALSDWPDCSLRVGRDGAGRLSDSCAGDAPSWRRPYRLPFWRRRPVLSRTPPPSPAKSAPTWNVICATFLPRLRSCRRASAAPGSTPTTRNWLRRSLKATISSWGPGSPSYTVRQLRDSYAWHALRARHRLGAAICFSRRHDGGVRPLHAAGL